MAAGLVGRRGDRARGRRRRFRSRRSGTTGRLPRAPGAAAGECRTRRLRPSAAGPRQRCRARSSAAPSSTGCCRRCPSIRPPPASRWRAPISTWSRPTGRSPSAPASPRRLPACSPPIPCAAVRPRQPRRGGDRRYARYRLGSARRQRPHRPAGGDARAGADRSTSRPTARRRRRSPRYRRITSCSSRSTPPCSSGSIPAAPLRPCCSIPSALLLIAIPRRDVLDGHISRINGVVTYQGLTACRCFPTFGSTSQDSKRGFHGDPPK